MIDYSDRIPTKDEIFELSIEDQIYVGIPSILSPGDQLSYAKKLFEDLCAASCSWRPKVAKDAEKKIHQAAYAFLKLSRSYHGSGTHYADDFRFVHDKISNLKKSRIRQILEWLWSFFCNIIRPLFIFFLGWFWARVIDPIFDKQTVELIQKHILQVFVP